MILEKSDFPLIIERGNIVIWKGRTLAWEWRLKVFTCFKTQTLKQKLSLQLNLRVTYIANGQKAQHRHPKSTQPSLRRGGGRHQEAAEAPPRLHQNPPTPHPRRC